MQQLFLPLRESNLIIFIIMRLRYWNRKQIVLTTTEEEIEKLGQKQQNSTTI